MALTRRRRRSIAILASVVLVVGAACSQTDVDPGATETVFLETCAPGGNPLETEVCRCAHDRIVEDLTPGELVRLDESLRADPGEVPAVVTEAALACASGPLTPSTRRPSGSG